MSYDDNRLLDPDDPAPLARYTLGSSVDVLARTERFNAVANVALQHIATSDETIERSRTDYAAGIEASHSISPVTTVDAELKLSEQSLLDGTSIDEGIAPEDETATTLEASVGVSKALSQRTTVSARVERTELDFSGNSLADYATTAAQVRVDHSVSERTAVSLDAGGLRTEPETLPNGPEQDTVEVGFVGAAIERAITEKLKVRGRLQPTLLNTGGKTSTKLAPELQVEYEGRRHAVSAGLARTFRPSGFGGLRQVDEVRASFQRAISPDVTAGVSAGYQEATILDRTSETKSATIGASAAWQLTDEWEVSLRYQWRSQETFQRPTAAQSNAGFMTLTYKPLIA